MSVFQGCKLDHNFHNQDCLRSYIFIKLLKTNNNILGLAHQYLIKLKT